MPIGKDSIQKRVAKATETAPVEEVKAEVAAPAEKPAAKKATAAKSASAGTEKTATAASGTKKAASGTKKAAAPKTTASKAEKKPVETATAVLSNVAPETVAAVIGHDEKKPADKVQIGQKMPNYLL